MDPRNAVAVKPPKMFELYLDPTVAEIPGLTIKVSEYQLIDTIRVLSQVYRITVSD